MQTLLFRKWGQNPGGGELPYEEYMGVCHELGSYFQEKIPKRVCRFFTKIQGYNFWKKFQIGSVILMAQNTKQKNQLIDYFSHFPKAALIVFGRPPLGTKISGKGPNSRKGRYRDHKVAHHLYHELFLNSSQHHCNPDLFSMLFIIFIKIHLSGK